MVFGLDEAIVTSSSAAMGVFGTLYDVGHASGPILAGFLISLAGGHDFPPAFAGIAAILICSALLFRRAIPASR